MGLFKQWFDLYQCWRSDIAMGRVPDDRGGTGRSDSHRDSGLYSDVGPALTTNPHPGPGECDSIHSPGPASGSDALGPGVKSKEAFEIAFEWILIAEGGKGIIPGDPGGYTSFGISQQFLDSHYPGRKAKDTTLEEAKDIYYEHFWPRGRYHNFETFNVALMYFDAAVNHGPGIAHRG